jgi:hypothetical protein
MWRSPGPGGLTIWTKKVSAFSCDDAGGQPAFAVPAVVAPSEAEGADSSKYKLDSKINDLCYCG